MYSAKFAPLNQNEDYKLDTVPHGSPQYTDPALYQQQMYQQQMHQQQASQQQPTQPAWQQPPPMHPTSDDKHGHHHTHVTYVSTPTEYSNGDQKPPFGANNRRKSSRLSFLADPVSSFKIPTFAAPWQHEAVDPPNSSSRTTTVRYFDRKKQWWRLFINGLLQWLMTVAIVGMIWITLWGFQQIKPMERWQRYTFNAVVTLLALCLGLAVVSALRSYAKLLSWRFLAGEYRCLQDFELVMNCSSQSKVLKLLWAGRKQGKFWLNRTQLLCIMSLSLVIGLQIVISLMGLTYSVESSDIYINYQPGGNVSLVDLTDIRPALYSSSSMKGAEYDTLRGAAINFYGVTGSTYKGYVAPPGEPHLYNNVEGYTGPESIGSESDNSTTYYYQFIEWSGRSLSPVFGETKRYVKTDATCMQLEIIEGGYSSNSTVSYYDVNGINRTQLLLETASLTSTYMTDPTDDSCGPRCATLLIIDTGYDPVALGETDDLTIYTPMLWTCNSTVSQVYNADTCTYKENCTLSDDTARLIAGGMGLSGITYTDEKMSFVRYPTGSMYSWGSLDTSYAKDVSWREELVSWFTAATIAAMDDNGPRFTAVGHEPTTGMVLEIKWYYTIPVLAIVPGVQLILLLIVCIWANGVMVKDGSYLATARLLRPIVEKMEAHGCALTGDEIARDLGNFKVIYGARAAKGGSSSTEYPSPGASDVDYHSGIIFESEGYGQQAAEGWRPGRVWPAGRYDGVGYCDEEQEIESDEKSHLL